MAEIDASKIRIAVIDDEKILLQTFSSLMRQFGYNADFFSSAPKALESVLANPTRYNLIIADIKMPEMDGITFVKKVRGILPNIPIIFMTGGVSEEMRQAALGVGNVVFLEKPFPLEATLKEAIPKLLGKKT